MSIRDVNLPSFTTFEIFIDVNLEIIYVNYSKIYVNKKNYNFFIFIYVNLGLT
jgi:hypothetical protein